MKRQMAAYHNAESMTASRGDLLLSLFDGALRFCAEGKAAIDRRDAEHKGRALGRAMAILDELTRALDKKLAPELAAELTALYQYYDQRLHEAGLKMLTQPIDEVIAQMSMLRHTWAEAVQKARAEGVSI